MPLVLIAAMFCRKPCDLDQLAVDPRDQGAGRRVAGQQAVESPCVARGMAWIAPSTLILYQLASIEKRRQPGRAVDAADHPALRRFGREVSLPPVLTEICALACW